MCTAPIKSTQIQKENLCMTIKIYKQHNTVITLCIGLQDHISVQQETGDHLQQTHSKLAII